MKKITLFLLGLLVMTSAIADENEYVPLVREGVVWEYIEYNSELGIQIGIADIYCLEFNGESEYGKMLYRTNYSENGVAQEPFLVAYVKEEDKVVSFTNIYYLMEYITIYDFNKQYFLPDEAIASYQFGPDGCPTSQTYTIEVGGTTRNCCHLNYDADIYQDLREVKIIEGIGADCQYGDLLKPFCDFPTGKSSLVPDHPFGWIMDGLSAVYENGELVYKGCLYDEAQLLKNPMSITTVAGDKQVKSVRYYNLAGVESAQPVKGVNIKVTTYSDGTRKSEKVIK